MRGSLAEENHHSLRRNKILPSRKALFPVLRRNEVVPPRKAQFSCMILRPGDAGEHDFQNGQHYSTGYSMRVARGGDMCAPFVHTVNTSRSPSVPKVDLC